MSGRAEGVLPLAVLGEPRGEHQPVLRVDGPGRFVTLVSDRLLLNLTGPVVKNTISAPLIALLRFFFSLWKALDSDKKI